MGVTKFLYSWGYRYFRAPWDGGGPRSELVELVESGRIPPCRAIDLGSGTGWNVIFLAQHGFEATGVDFASGAIELGRNRARAAGVTATFVEDDLTNLQHVAGPFDLLVDYGTLDDLPPKGRDLYVQNILPLTRLGSLFLLFCFEWPARWWERLLPFTWGALDPGEAERRFGEHFEIERIAGKSDLSGYIRGFAVYLMIRKGGFLMNQTSTETVENRGGGSMRPGLAYFRFVALVFIASGLLGLILPDQYISLLGASASVGGRLWGRAFGAVSIGFGAMFWMMDPGGDQRARRMGAVGAALAFGLTGLGDVVSVLTADLPAYGWGFVAFNAVMVALALYYFITPPPSAKVRA